MLAVSGVKRARMTFDEQKPSVRVMYFSLTRLVGGSDLHRTEQFFFTCFLFHIYLMTLSGAQ